jgi:DNA modification methylase
MEIKQVGISDLNPAPHNPRTHPQKAIERLTKSIEQFGFTNPILVQEGTNTVIAGHARLKASEKAGLQEVPVIFLNMDDVTAKAYNIADNRLAELTEWDFPALKDLITEIDTGAIDIELTGFSEVELKDIVDYDIAPPDEKDDVVPEVDESDPICKMGDLWQLGRHRLLCGDATKKEDVERLMGGKKADMVFTDPPYGMNHDPKMSLNVVRKGNWKSKPKAYEKVIGDDKPFNPNCVLDVFSYCPEVFLWGADYYAKQLPCSGSWFVWDKRHKLEGIKFTSSEFELCWSKQKHLRQIARVRWMGLCGTEQEHDHCRCHPTQKPTLLCEWFIEKYSDEGGHIVDLFAGSGSTLIACEKTARVAFVSEIAPNYCDVIIKRWEDYTGEKAVKLNNT